MDALQLELAVGSGLKIPCGTRSINVVGECGWKVFTRSFAGSVRAEFIRDNNETQRWVAEPAEHAEQAYSPNLPDPGTGQSHDAAGSDWE